ncbi:GNAT family N-acetyltransferase [Xinfangfangia pollutisoli]|uniref:GNAT family N-acetyltransferase n=1 Tax=Xinfangfangia pollutisoli TaxID=2865960 RepID=UPI001CD7F158|nr:GNAT family protein [Xinfangfangia pollutisoli]
MILRPARPEDAPAMAALLNQIIRIGGTTAHQREKPAAQVRGDYIDGPGTLCCHVAEDQGDLIGFQALGRNAALPEDWGDIGTFVRPGLQARGTGAALFQATLAAARAAGLRAINATIRADNVPGLAYYARLGFVDYAHDPDWALGDGTVTGRISRRFDL